ncbi:hypothetical protein MHK01_01805 [Staphylococcus auricularis]|uniref:glycerophosphodiester phosphodiesterase family protein n=1 Tax=Staphylococcus auricularis TaxID=29379 RepID=UPI001EF2690B|nr:glycerophosphodiester phosphodiesterase family protein [Staphylococcus auricularis]MCG7340768.1 hypothetical protein [Staphylococcus auricularis]
MAQYREHLDKLLNQNSNCIITAHQGSAGGNIGYNTFKALENAIYAGAQFVEFDITKSLDGTFYIFHENEELIRLKYPELLKTSHDDTIQQLQHYNMNNKPIGPVETLAEMMENMKKHPEIIMHVDHVSKWKGEILDELDQYEDQASQFIVKIDANNEEAVEAVRNHGIKFMTIVIIRNKEELERVLELTSEMNVVGIEILFESTDESHVQSDAIQMIHDHDMFVLINSIKLDDEEVLSAHADDEVSIFEDPDKGWGKLLDIGCDAIQTDWVAQLNSYLLKREAKRG